MNRHALISLSLAAIAFLAFAGCPESASKVDPSQASTGVPGDASQVKSGEQSPSAAPSRATAETTPPRAQQVATTDENVAAAAHHAEQNGGYDKSEVPDPIKTNGPIFEGWAKPHLAFVFTGEQAGYIEPCGCAGPGRQLGGMARRHTFLEQLRQEGWPLVAADLGGLTNRFGRQGEIKYQIAAEGLAAMDYSAIGFSPQDLKLPVEGLVAVAATDPEQNGPFVSANVNLLDLIKPYRVITLGGKKIGITTVLGDRFAKEVTSSDVQIAPAEKALAQVVPKMQAECDLLVLMAFAKTDESRALAKRFPEFDFVVTADGGDVPPNDLRTVDGTKQVFVEVGQKGKYAIVLGFFDDPKNPIRYQRVPLDTRFGDSRRMKDLMVAYQGQLEQLGFEGLGVRPKVSPVSQKSGDPAGQYVGSDKCADCHTKAFAVWSKTPHAHATESLEKATPPRMHDPECLSCHATGWSPQEYLPYESGFISRQETPNLVGNGCENCHGPGGAHVAAESDGANDATLAILRKRMKVAKANVELQLCIKCHDQDNSPEFHHDGAFERYWKEIEHYGKD